MNILVTGGASGLCASIVKNLASGNVNDIVYFTYANSAKAAKETEEAFKNTRAIFCDFGHAQSLEDLLAQLPDLGLDILVNNAYSGIHKEHFHKIDYHVFKDSFELNVLPVLRITAAAIKVFRKKKFGKIINVISSVVVNKPPTGWSGYAADKAYLLAMSKAWATECIKFNVTSNCISPSFMLTQMTSDTDERQIEQMVEEHPLKKLLTTDEVADAVSYLARASQQINGTNLIINAGMNLV